MYACWNFADNSGDSGRCACVSGYIVSPLATVTIGPLVGLMYVQCGTAACLG